MDSLITGRRHNYDMRYHHYSQSNETYIAIADKPINDAGKVANGWISWSRS